MRDVRRQQRTSCASAAAVAEEAPVSLAEEASEAAALVGVAPKGPDDRGLLPTPAQRAAGRCVGRRDGGSSGPRGVAAQ